MSFISKLSSIPTIFQHKPSAKLGATSVKPEPAAPVKSGDRASHGALYNSKRGLTIRHKDRKHIDTANKDKISDIDHEINIQASYGDASSIAKILTELLEQPCFKPSEHMLNEEMDKSSAALLSGQRGDAQKTALETFTKVFPLTISKDNNKHLDVLKKLIDTLPNLEHHKTIEQNPQLRGISVLKEALGSLSPNDVAAILVHQMDGIHNLSNERSRHKVISNGSAASLSRKTAKTVASKAPFVSLVYPMWEMYSPEAAAKESRAIKSQPQGAALYMLKDQLKKLRKDWDTLTQDNKQQLITAFNNLKDKDKDNDMFGTRSPNLRTWYTHKGLRYFRDENSNLRKHFNDKKVDPSKF